MRLGGPCNERVGRRTRPPRSFVGNGATHQASEKPSEAARAIEDVPVYLAQPAPRPGERPALDGRAHYRQIEE